MPEDVPGVSVTPAIVVGSPAGAAGSDGLGAAPQGTTSTIAAVPDAKALELQSVRQVDATRGADHQTHLCGDSWAAAVPPKLASITRHPNTATRLTGSLLAAPPNRGALQSRRLGGVSRIISRSSSVHAPGAPA